GVYTGLIRDGQPTLNEYKSILISSEHLQESWSKVIETAMEIGLEPEQVRQIVEMQGFIAKRINKEK
ncbi:MAG: hypothetical protein SCK28_09090, partial [Bacillota bacterium]|nr:hypothetical protein [Bacillota bacterium]